MTGAQIAKRFGVSTKAVTNDWAKDGCPRNPDKSFDLDKVVAWRKAKLSAAANDPAVKMQASKTALQAKRLMLQCEKLEIEVMVTKGKLHDKDACSARITECLSKRLRSLLSIGDTAQSKFPEVPGLKDECDKIVEVALDGCRRELIGG